MGRTPLARIEKRSGLNELAAAPETYRDYFRKLCVDYCANFADYQSDIYTNRAAGYYPSVVWQFWGRAAEAS